MPIGPHRRALAAAAMLLTAALTAWPAGAQTKGAAPQDPETVEQIRAWNAECLECHTEAALKKPPRQDMDMARLAEAITDPDLYAKSAHAGMACRTCHVGGYRGFPHRPAPADTAVASTEPPAKPETLECAECHAQKTARIDDQVARSVHSKNLDGKFTCSSCHDPHAYNVASRLVEPQKIVGQDNAMCLDCHDSDEKFAKFGGTLTPIKARPNIDTIHGFLPNTKRHWQAVRCVECHTPAATTKALALSHEILNKDKAEQNCVACHSTNSALSTRLYRYVAENETAKLGFLNSAILGESYVIGATRNPYLDLLSLGLVGLTLAGVAGHAGIRILAALGRRRTK